MARKVLYTTATTDEDVLRVCKQSPLTRGDIAEKLERSKHAKLIERIERLARQGWLIVGRTELINRVLAYTYQTHPAWIDPSEETLQDVS